MAHFTRARSGLLAPPDQDDEASEEQLRAPKRSSGKRRRRGSEEEGNASSNSSGDITSAAGEGGSSLTSLSTLSLASSSASQGSDHSGAAEASGDEVVPSSRWRASLRVRRRAGEATIRASTATAEADRNRQRGADSTTRSGGTADGNKGTSSSRRARRATVSRSGSGIGTKVKGKAASRSRPPSNATGGPYNRPSGATRRSRLRSASIAAAALSPPETESECTQSKPPLAKAVVTAAAARLLLPSPTSGGPLAGSGSEDEEQTERTLRSSKARRVRSNARSDRSKSRRISLESSPPLLVQPPAATSAEGAANDEDPDGANVDGDPLHTPASMTAAPTMLDPSLAAFAALPTPGAATLPALPRTPHARRIGVADRFVPDRTREDSAMRYRLSLMEDDPSSPLSGRRGRQDGTLEEDELEAHLYQRVLKNELFGSYFPPERDIRSARRTLFFNVPPAASSSSPGVGNSGDVGATANGLSAELQQPIGTAALGDDCDEGDTTETAGLRDGIIEQPRPPPPSLPLSSPATLQSPAWTTADAPRLNIRRGLSGSGRPQRARIADGTALLDNPFFDTCPLHSATRKLLAAPRPERRVIPKLPYKVLDAPELADDFYLNLIDWGSQNVLAVGLGSCIYLWNSESAMVNKLCDLAPFDEVTSLRWNARGDILGVGTNRGEVQLWDVTQQTKLRTKGGHTGRVGALAWRRNLLTSGSRDRAIHHWDPRRSGSAATDAVAHLAAHRQEVCGLQWSGDETRLASGGNDNRLFVWDAGHMTTPLLRYTEHSAAIKAIAWSPHHSGLLASGGGTADQHLRFWNTKAASTSSIQAVNTHSQVCNVAWSRSSDELVTTHGYSQNQVVVWRYPTMTQLATLTGHLQRVLYLAVAPDGERICTGAADETLRFWTVFPKARRPEARVPQYSQWTQYR